MRSQFLLLSLAGIFVSVSLGRAQPPATPEGLPPAAPNAPAAVSEAEPPLNFVTPASNPGRFWVSAEYLLWWIKASPLPNSLVANASNLTLSELESGAVFSRPALLGGDLGSSVQNGGRFRAGYWFDAEQTVGLEASYFFLGQRSASRSVTTPAGTPWAAR